MQIAAHPAARVVLNLVPAAEAPVPEARPARIVSGDLNLPVLPAEAHLVVGVQVALVEVALRPPDNL